MAGPVVLVGDDEAIIRAVVADIRHLAGYAVATAADGVAALMARADPRRGGGRHDGGP